MQSNNYKTLELADKGVDFSTIFPEKQVIVKEMTGMDFSLPQIVSFLRKQTNNGAEQIPLALDIDKHIYSIYLKSGAKEGTKPAETSGEDKPAPTLKVLETRLKIISGMLKKDAKNTVLKTRLKIVTKQIENIKSKNN